MSAVREWYSAHFARQNRKEMIFCNLGSGSKGNSSYLQNDRKAILIDQGFSLKNLVTRFAQVNLRPEDVAAIVVTHEHSDHVNGVGIFARRYHIPVYLTEKTRSAVSEPVLKNVVIEHFVSGDEFDIEDIRFKTFHIAHDAADPIGIVASAGEKRVGILTDVGTDNQSVIYHVSHLDLLFLEANHDMFMLLNGPYPLRVIQRIKSRVGHLSNDQSVELLRKLEGNGRLQHLVLGHLSDTNNDPDIVREFFEKARQEQAGQFQIDIALQNIPGKIFEI